MYRELLAELKRNLSADTSQVLDGLLVELTVSGDKNRRDFPRVCSAREIAGNRSVLKCDGALWFCVSWRWYRQCRRMRIMMSGHEYYCGSTDSKHFPFRSSLASQIDPHSCTQIALNSCARCVRLNLVNAALEYCLVNTNTCFCHLRAYPKSRL